MSHREMSAIETVVRLGRFGVSRRTEAQSRQAADWQPFSQKHNFKWTQP